MFPVSMEGSVSVHSNTEAEANALAGRICAEIEPLGLRGWAEGTVVSLTNDTSLSFQMTRFDRSIQITDGGEFSVLAEEIRYRLSTVTAFAIYSMLASLPLVFCLVLRSVIGTCVVIVWWLAPLVLGYFVLGARIRRALHRAATSSPNLSP